MAGAAPCVCLAKKIWGLCRTGLHFNIYSNLQSKQLLTYCACCSFHVFQYLSQGKLQFGFLRSRRAGCVPSEGWGCGALGLGFWALSWWFPFQKDLSSIF